MKSKPKETPPQASPRNAMLSVVSDAHSRPEAQPLRFLRMAEVQKRVGLSRATIYRFIKIKDGFPSPISLGSSAVGWLEHEVDAWARERIAVSRCGTEAVR